ncbi:hypothetical protein BU17DRAFT_91348 [Hysterangium stoloniferum]|nr:hypothetical protein BU17DRAFT_91348 [Hysterangium stoloniferum]
MPPHTGVFPLPSKASRPDTHLGSTEASMSYGIGGFVDDPRSSKDRKRRDIAGKLAKDLTDHRRDDMASRFNEALASHQQASHQLSVAPHLFPEYVLALYPISLERAARLHQLVLDEEYALECAHAAWEEERARVEEEWRKGRERIRDRMLEGIEERRKRAREDKDGEGTVADAAMDSQSRPHVTRKLRNKASANHSAVNGRSPSPSIPTATVSTQPSTVILTNPYSLALDTLPSPFPLALPLKEPPPRRGGKQAAPTQQTQSGGLGNGRGGNVEANLVANVGTGAAMGLGKSLTGLTSARDIDIENDLTELRRGARRKRQVAANLGRV